MDAPKGEQHGPVIERERVLATYQHVRERWGLKNTDTARMKAKRAEWAYLPKNSPSEVTRLIVPREQWDAAGNQSQRTNSLANGEQAERHSRGTGPRTAKAIPLPDLAELQAALTRLVEQSTSDLKEARDLADRRATELAELRERVGRAEAERDQARGEQERVERKLGETQAELAAWTADGPLARALRALLYRRGI